MLISVIFPFSPTKRTLDEQCAEQCYKTKLLQCSVAAAVNFELKAAGENRTWITFSSPVGKFIVFLLCERYFLEL